MIQVGGQVVLKDKGGGVRPIPIKQSNEKAVKHNFFEQI